MSDSLLWCAEDDRSAVLAAPAHPLGGVAFAEYARVPAAPPGERHRLDVIFVKPPPAGLAGNPAAFAVEGGIRVTGIAVLGAVAVPGQPAIRLFLDQEGDFSAYIVRVTHAGIDPERSEASFSFKAGCPSPFDCRTETPCEEPLLAEPALDYLAKDYQSFRRLLLDLARQIDPEFEDTGPASLSVTLVELFAGVGDYLSYFQDAAATEAFFDTCRRRVSAARHARLIDQRLHEGRNAHGFVQFDAAPGGDGTILQGVKLLTRVSRPLRGMGGLPGLLIAAGDADFDGDPALADVAVFETTAPVRVMAGRNRLVLHDWGDGACCLGAGAREAFLYATAADGDDLVASRPDIVPGEYLLLQETRGVRTGLSQDADPRQRHVVRIEAVEPGEDPAFRDRLVLGVLTPRTAAQAPLPLLKVRWGVADALPFPLCLSARHPVSAQPIRPIAEARANVAPVDHGRTVVRQWPPPFPGARSLPPPDMGRGRLPIASVRLPEGPLTFQKPARESAAQALFAPDGRPAVGRHGLAGPPEDMEGAVTLLVTEESGTPRLFTPVPHLLDSGPDDAHLVAEPDEPGYRLRFGDGRNGRRPGRILAMQARFRVGNGRGGNIGAGALAHVIHPEAAELVDPADPGGVPLPFPLLAGLHQPLPATGGTDAQPLAELKAVAPAAMRAETFRAVTAADWEAKARALPGVAAARATFLWTGSWLTIFLAIHPADPEDLFRLPGGAAVLRPEVARRLRASLERFRIAGYDLVVRAAVYVPLRLAARLCLAPGHFRGDVLRAASDALSNRRLPGGTTGLFHPSRLGFGGPVYLSQVHAA
ncbi:MAG: hypothetical protein SNJ63_07875, partial [Sphingomonadaceae bacterium]